MSRRTIFGLSTVALLSAGFALTDTAIAQTAKDLVGTWEHVSSVNTAKDGTKTNTFGVNPKGIMVFGSDGRYALIFTRSDLPKFASGNRLQGTPDENKAIVQGSIANYGTYSVADKVLIQHVEGGTWSSWNGTDQKRTLSSFTGDEFKWTISSSIGGTSESTFRRIK